MKSTVLIRALTEKISLGLLNAPDHENAGRSLWLTKVKGLYNENFFGNTCRKSSGRSCRSGRPFTLMAVSWRNNGDEAFASEEVMDLYSAKCTRRRCCRSGRIGGLWLLLPETESRRRGEDGERLLSLCKAVFPETDRKHRGTEFLEIAAAATVLLNLAQEALEEAVTENVPVVTKSA